MTIEHAIALSKIQPVENEELLKYMAQLGIPSAVCQKYLDEVKLYNRIDKKHFITFGMPNDGDGYEVQNEFYSGWVNGKRDISFIRGRKHPSRNLHVFFHMNDFLTLVAREEHHSFVSDSIILHNLDFLDAIPECLYLFQYKQLYSWMPNNDHGKTAIDTLSACCLAQTNCEHVPMNRFYSKHETIQEWCVAHSKVIKS